MKYIPYTCGEQPINKHILQMERHIYDKDVIGCVQQNTIFWNEKGYGHWFWSKQDIQALNESGKKLLDHETAKKSIQEQTKAVKGYWITAKKLIEATDKNQSKIELTNIYDKYIYALRRVYAHFITTTEHVIFPIESRLKEILKNKFPKDDDDFYIILTTPEKPDFLFQELQDWKKVLENPTKENILTHTKEYSILLANVFSKEEVLEWAKNRIEQKSLEDIEKEIQESEERKKQLKIKQDDIFKKLNSKQAEELSWFIREGAITRLLLKSCWNGEAYNLLSFYKKIARVAECSVQDVCMFYTWKEIIDLLQDNVNISKEELEKRKEYFLLHFSNQEINAYSGKEALDMKKKILDPSLPSKDIKSFSGSIANKGKVIGKAKIVKADNPNKLAEIASTLEPDNILVTGMTNPTMMVLVNKVKGIITDEGGIACHAAIISRELNLPCVVGCSIATLVLKDGDLIELDADKGIVKKLTQT